MAREATITYERVAEIATMLKSKSITPTSRAVRAELGTGSMATICKLLRKWREQTGTARTSPSEIAPSVASAIEAFVTSKVEEATANVMEQLADARESLEATIQENERQDDRIKQLSQELADSQNECARLLGQIDQLRADMESAESRLAQERQKAEGVRIELAKAESRLDEIPRMKGEIEELRAALAAAKDEAAELRGAISVIAPQSNSSAPVERL